MCEEGWPPSKEITTLFTHDTQYSADSVEWCPHEPFRNLFVCANYQLKEAGPESRDTPCERLGRVLLFSISPETGLSLLQTVNLAAVLDQKWCYNRIGGVSLLGIVTARNSLEIYKLDAEILQLELVTLHQIPEGDTETLLLSLDWSTNKLEDSEPQIVCSDSKGNLHRFRFSNDRLILEDSWHGHEFEAWIAAFYYWDLNIVFSGGDDCLFLKFDKRSGKEPVARNRSHEAGVTCMHSNASKEFVLATGSYDSFIRLWDIRQLRTPTNSVKMPGTLWRLKWDPFHNSLLLAACMLGGVHVASGEDLTIIESYYEHKNISYGADWSHLPEEETSKFEHPGNVVIGTCSFYDHLLCVSKLNCKFEK